MARLFAIQLNDDTRGYINLDALQAIFEKDSGCEILVGGKGFALKESMGTLIDRITKFSKRA